MSTNIFAFVIVLGVLIFFHELGHFLVARFFGVGVEKFSLGFGPKIFGKTIGITDYRISAIPLGGYVKMVGEEPDAEIDPNDIHYRELFFTGTFSHSRASFRQAVQAISVGQVDLFPFVSAEVPFPAVQEGFELAIRPDTYRVVVTF